MSLIARASILATTSQALVTRVRTAGQMYEGRETVREDQKLYLSAAAPKTNQDSTAHQLEMWRAAWF
ncbi:MAG TPA: hypothetical protein VLB68_10190 [Pyrinomonadaceae bacterium]|nr:hypothetical protein [Pyrinomonadaceae bacterium]